MYKNFATNRYTSRSLLNGKQVLMVMMVERYAGSIIVARYAMRSCKI